MACKRPDCVIENYSVQIGYSGMISGALLNLATFDWNNTHVLDESLITIDRPHDPDTIHEHIPKITLVQYLCYLGGAVGMWFGFSIYELKSIIPRLAGKMSVQIPTTRSA